MKVADAPSGPSIFLLVYTALFFLFTFIFAWIQDRLVRKGSWWVSRDRLIIFAGLRMHATSARPL